MILFLCEIEIRSDIGLWSQVADKKKDRQRVPGNNWDPFTATLAVCVTARNVSFFVARFN